MDIKSFLDSTYLKTADQAGISENENAKLVANCIQEAIDENFKLVMIRPEMVSLAKKMVTNQKSKVTIGTVIDFPKGNSNYSKKIKEAINVGSTDVFYKVPSENSEYKNYNSIITLLSDEYKKQIDSNIN